jgi:hypothetical protein
MRDPHSSEKELRSLLRGRALKLAGMKLPTALDLISDFYKKVRDFDVVDNEGDGLAAYKDTTDHGRGTRIEIGFTRLFRLRPDNENDFRYPALRLRLRHCFKWDMDVIKFVLPEPTWSFDCWSAGELEQFRMAVENTVGYSMLKEKVPSEVNIVLEDASYRREKYKFEPDVKQMWWGNVDVA